MYRLKFPLFKVFLLSSVLLASPLSTYAQSLESDNTIIQLSAQGSHIVANDVVAATAYIEVTDKKLAHASEQANQAIEKAIALSKEFPDVKVQNGQLNTWPRYKENSSLSKNEQQSHVSFWEVRSELKLESHNIEAISTLLGKLQAFMAVSSLNMHPSEKVKDSASNTAASNAIEAFQRRAEQLAKQLNSGYKIRKLNVQYQDDNYYQPIEMMRASAAPAYEKSAKMPIQAGESVINVNVNGAIELTPQ